MKSGQVVIPAQAPQWMSQMVSNLTDYIQAQLSGPQRLTIYTVANKPDPTKFRGCLIGLSNGASNKDVAYSDGTIWRYPDGSAV